MSAYKCPCYQFEINVGNILSVDRSRNNVKHFIVVDHGFVADIISKRDREYCKFTKEHYRTSFVYHAVLCLYLGDIVSEDGEQVDWMYCDYLNRNGVKLLC